MPSDGGSELYIGSQRPPVRVTAMGVFQRYSGVLIEDTPEVGVSEFSAPLVIFAPLARNVGFSLRSSFTSVTGDAPPDAPRSGAEHDERARAHRHAGGAELLHRRSGRAAPS